MRGSWSFSNYTLFEAAAAAPRMANGKLDVTGRIGWRDATHIPFHGVGIATTGGDRTNARINETCVEAAALYRPRTRVLLRGSGAYEAYTEKSGQGPYPSVAWTLVGLTRRP